ncbi:TetR family transcriptional regulator [Nonomuraea sp. NPDC050536]|uniref:TetR family transcriptional regulator n=1 Tax=Nonomuraea sp. NPDC050536 TaxID=3364366 RepID=UPI0037C8BA9C
MGYDADATRARIFEAATTEFAEHGVAGARVDRIAEQARANKASIYSYFGNKEQLFAAVLGRKLQELMDAVCLDPARIADYAGELFDYHLAHPEVIRLLMHEALRYRDEAVPEQARRTEEYLAKSRALQAGQEAGVIDSELDPRHLLLMLMGQVCWFFAMPHVSRMLLSEPVDSEVVAAYRASVVEGARRLLKLGTLDR